MMIRALLLASTVLAAMEREAREMVHALAEATEGRCAAMAETTALRTSVMKAVGLDWIGLRAPDDADIAAACGQLRDTIEELRGRVTELTLMLDDKEAT